MAYVRVQPCTSVRTRSPVYVAFIQGEPQRTEHSDILAREIVLTEISRSPMRNPMRDLWKIVRSSKLGQRFFLNSFSSSTNEFVYY